MSYVNPSDERTEVRMNCGNTGESNLAEADIDKALSMADEETTERTGLLPDDIRMPDLRRKMKVLIASAYLMIRFSNLVDVRASVLKEIDNLTEKMQVLEDTSAIDDETIMEEGVDDEYVASTVSSFWTGGKRRSSSRVTDGSTVTGWAEYADIHETRTGEF